ncbi:MAG: type II toxin-antitoxin system Phd/YefM family antitoxin [Thermoanaerobaculia bacterium]|nr:type II toxin-antitoxin system Phd/YefM family antitoxin [Thermoanaerobaculia bacterium]
MMTVKVEDLQRDFLSYLRQTPKGETLVVTAADRPVAEIKPIAPPTRQARPFGLCAGEFIVPRDFDAPLPEDVLRQFEGD